MRIISFIKLFKSTMLLDIFGLLTSPGFISANQFHSLRLQENGEDITEDYWDTVNPASLGIDYKKLDDMDLYISGKGLKINSINILKEGYLVYERYEVPMRKKISHLLYSATKSVISILVGIAIEQDLISLNDKIVDFFPNGTIDNMDGRKENTIYHLLTMTDGLAWYEVNDETNNIGDWTYSNSMEKYVIDKPMRADPGAIWSYNSGASHLLSYAIQSSLQRENIDLTTFEFAKKFLFDALQIPISTKTWVNQFPAAEHSSTGNLWYSSPGTNILFGPSLLYLRTHDMLKVGELMVNNGTWNGEQIVAKEWIIESTKIEQLLTTYPNDYGYHWWIFDSFVYTGFVAAGAYGQRIYVIPTIQMVVTFTSHEGGNHAKELLDLYIAPSYSSQILENYLASQESNKSGSLLIFPAVESILLMLVVVFKKKR